MGKLFGAFLKKLREDRNMSLRDVEREAKISNAYLSQVERGERGTPTMKVLSRLAIAYGVPLNDLTVKAEDELSVEESSSNKSDTNKISSPDSDFICRGYENLSEEKKNELKKYLKYLESLENKK